jgi:hypothetical protein
MEDSTTLLPAFWRLLLLQSSSPDVASRSRSSLEHSTCNFNYGHRYAHKACCLSAAVAMQQKWKDSKAPCSLTKLFVPEEHFAVYNQAL